MKITQEERQQFRELFNHIQMITDPSQVRTEKTVFIPIGMIKRMEQVFTNLGRSGFWSKLRELLDSASEGK